MRWRPTISPHPRRFRARAPAVLAGLTALLLTVPGAAQAADWDLVTKNGGWSKNDNRSGHADAEGRISFANKRRVKFDVWHIKDVCNPAGTNDGVGAHLYIEIKYMNRDIDYGGPIAHDTNGCSNGFSQVVGFVIPAERRIRSARVQLWECKNGCSWYSRDSKYSSWKDNPHTG